MLRLFDLPDDVIVTIFGDWVDQNIDGIARSVDSACSPSVRKRYLEVIRGRIFGCGNQFDEFLSNHFRGALLWLNSRMVHVTKLRPSSTASNDLMLRTISTPIKVYAHELQLCDYGMSILGSLSPESIQKLINSCPVLTRLSLTGRGEVMTDMLTALTLSTNALCLKRLKLELFDADVDMELVRTVIRKFGANFTELEFCKLPIIDDDLRVINECSPNLIKFRFDCCYLQSADALLAFCKAHPRMLELCLFANSCTTVEVKPILTNQVVVCLISYMPQLKKLICFTDCGATCECFPMIMRSAPNLNYVFIDGFNVHPSDVYPHMLCLNSFGSRFTLDAFIAMVKGCCHKIQAITINDPINQHEIATKLDYNCIRAVMQLVPVANLVQIQCKFHPAVDRSLLCSFFQKFIHLRIVWLDKCPLLKAPIFQAIAESCRELEVFVVLNNKYITNTIVKTMLLNCPKLRWLRLASCRKISAATLTNVGLYGANIYCLGVEWTRVDSNAILQNLISAFPYHPMQLLGFKDAAFETRIMQTDSNGLLELWKQKLLNYKKRVELR